MSRRNLLALAACALSACAAALGCDDSSSSSSSSSQTTMSSSGPDTGSGAGGAIPYDGVAFPNRRAPLAIPAGGLALVASAGSDTLSAVGAAKGDLIATLPVGRDPVTIDDPEGIAAHAASGNVYAVLAYQDLHAALHEDGSGSHVQPAYVQRLALADLSVTGEVELPEQPRGLAISDDGSRLVTAHFSSPGELAAQMTPDALEAARGRLSVIDTSTIETVFSETPPSVTACIGARSVALSGDGGRAFVACFDEDAVAVVDLSGDGFTVQRVPAGPDHGLPGLPVHGPAAVALSGDGARAFLANELAKQVRVLDVASAAVSETDFFTAEGTPVALAVAKGTADGSVYLLTAEPAAVLRLSAELEAPAMDEHTFTSAECAVPAALVATFAGTLVVTCAAAEEGGAGRAVTLDAATLAVLGSADTGAKPRAAAVVPGGAP